MSGKIVNPVKKGLENNDGIFMVFIRVPGTRIFTLLMDVFLLFFI
jgi:hypothetical protein